LQVNAVNFDDLTRDQKIAHWRETEQCVRAALSHVKEEISPESLTWVEKFLDHNELGLAMETLQSAAKRVAGTENKQFMEALNEARVRMNYPAIRTLEEAE
jgi:hypothetical protein